MLPSSLTLRPRTASPSEGDPRARRSSAECPGAGSAGGDAQCSGVVEAHLRLSYLISFLDLKIFSTVKYQFKKKNICIAL